MGRAKPWGATRSMAGRSPWIWVFGVSGFPPWGLVLFLREGGADAKRWGNPVGVPFTRR